MKQLRYLMLAVSIIWGALANSEPFISTDKGWIRADIETLANIGVIKAPITTWPLTWGPILKDLSNTKVGNIPEAYQDAYFRVLREGRRETGKDSSFTEVRISFNQESQLFRQFGDKAREKREFSTRTSGMTNNFAWNLEATAMTDVAEGNKKKRFDGSYIAGIGGNWIFYAGEVEKWWGPGFQNSLILSNNAKPIPAINFQRNYAEEFESPLLSWLGPWSFQSFIGQLDDPRTINDAKLLGMSVTLKPCASLEVGFRRTAQWGGDGRPETFDSLADMFIGLDNCDESDLSCEDQSNEPGNQLAGIDLSWRNNFIVPANIYMQMVGEDEAGYFPSKKSYLYGVNFNVSIFDNPLWINIESLETTVDGDGNEPGVPFDGYNVLYEHSLYRHGYRYYGRSIGATIDNDSSVLALNIVYQSEEYGKFSVSNRLVELNKDSVNASEPGGHSIVDNSIKFSELALKWNYLTREYGEFEFSYIARDESFESNWEKFESNSLGLNWVIRF